MPIILPLFVQGPRDMAFTGSSMTSIQAAFQAGIGVPTLPKGPLRKGLRKAPAHLELDDL